MASTQMPFPEILMDFYGVEMPVEKLNADLEEWSALEKDAGDHPEVNFDELGLRIEAVCAYLIWKEGKKPLPSEPKCDIPTGDYYAR